VDCASGRFYRRYVPKVAYNYTARIIIIIIIMPIIVSRCDDLATFTVPKVEKIRSLNLPDPQGLAQACSGGGGRKNNNNKTILEPSQNHTECT
jgi:hypothetical protein